MSIQRETAQVFSQYEFLAFICYRRQDASGVARWLRNRLLRYAPPKSLLASLSEEQRKSFLRSRNFFLDTAYQKTNEDFWKKNIEPALGRSQYLIVISSPAAFQPLSDGNENWVVREIDQFYATHGDPSKIMIVLAAGAPTDRYPGRMAALSERWDWADFRGYMSPLWRWFSLPRAAKLDDEFLKIVADLFDVPPQFLPALRQEEAKRRLRVVRAVIAAVLFAAAGFAGLAGWAEANRREAVRQRYRAEKTLSAATETANTLVLDLAHDFRNRTGVQVETVRRILDRARRLQAQLLQEGETSAELRFSEARALGELATTLLAQGAIEDALAASTQLLGTIEALAGTAPGNAAWQQFLSVSYEQRGVILAAAGRRKEAFEALRRSLATIELLSASEPSNPMWQYDLSISHSRIGNFLIDDGRREDALKSYQAALTIREALARAQPSNLLFQRNLAIGCEKVGDALFDLGKLEEALAHYGKSLPIYERLVSEDSGNDEWQQDLAVGRYNVARALERLGRPAEALEEYRKSLSIAQKLANDDPNNDERQRDLTTAYSRLGDALSELDNKDEARDAYLKGVGTLERLVGKDPNNLDWKWDLSLAYTKMSGITLEARELDMALEFARKSVTLREYLHSVELPSFKWRLV
jgi:tetratricopeptide (TPR) repeat protein